jgi:hypothetical protein
MTSQNLKKRYTLCPDSSVSMTTHFGDKIHVPFHDLVSLFGSPLDVPSEKIQHEWIFTGPHGSIITLFDWYSNDFEPDVWHVGGFRPEHTRDFVKWFKQIREQL